MSEVADMVRGAYEAFSRGEMDTVVELLHPNVEWVPPPSSLDPRPLRGRDAVREYLAPNIFDEQSAEPVELIEDGRAVRFSVHLNRDEALAALRG